MTATPCAIDKRATPDGYVCAGCAARAAGHLAAIIELAPDARLVAAGLVRRGVGGGGGGKPGSRPPLNDGATDVIWAVENTLTTMAREIADTRGLQTPRDGHTHSDPLTVVCKWLTGQLEWARHATDEQGGAYAVHAFAEIEACASRLRGLVEGPRERVYLGPCGAEAEVMTDVVEAPGVVVRVPVLVPCDGDIYAPRGGSVGRCRACEATVAADDRRAWLDGEVRAHAFRAVEIGKAYGVNVNTIRSWATRGQLVAHGEDRDQRPLYNVGEVLDLAAADAARRAGEQAKRARRKDTAA